MLPHLIALWMLSSPFFQCYLQIAWVPRDAFFPRDVKFIHSSLLVKRWWSITRMKKICINMLRSIKINIYNNGIWWGLFSDFLFVVCVYLEKHPYWDMNVQDKHSSPINRCAAKMLGWSWWRRCWLASVDGRWLIPMRKEVKSDVTCCRLVKEVLGRVSCPSAVNDSPIHQANNYLLLGRPVVGIFS